MSHGFFLILSLGNNSLPPVELPRVFAAHIFGSGQASFRGRFRGRSVHGGFGGASARAFVMLEVDVRV